MTSLDLQQGSNTRQRWVSVSSATVITTVVSMVVVAFQIPGSKLWPWAPAMIDLDVYRRTGELMLAGQDFFNADGLPWIYPPFAAFFTAPLSVLPLIAAQLLWLVLCALSIVAICYRLGLTGWRLTAVSAASVVLVNPVTQTLGFGQVGIFLVALVALDTIDGPRILGRRLLPEGWLTGIATAIKLTPAVIAVYNFFARRLRPAFAAFGAFVVATLLGLFVLPAASVRYWGGLATGEFGLGDSVAYAMNQSVMSVWARLFGTQTPDGMDVAFSSVGMGLSVLVIALGVLAAVMMQRAGQSTLAVCLAGLASLLGSPISWSHHYIWILPLAIVLWQVKQLSMWYRIFGGVYVLWYAISPFGWLPRSHFVELQYDFGQQIVDDIGVYLGVLFLVASLVVAWRVRMRQVSLGIN